MCICSLTGESGCGKSAIAREIMKANPKARPVPSITTRDPRPSDLPGEYEYATTQEFAAMKSKGEFLWDVEHGGKCYGTRRADVLSAVEDRSSIGIMILVPEVLPKLHALMREAGADERDWVVYYIKPLAESVVRERMLKRKDDPLAIERRIRAERGWSEDMWRFQQYRKVHMINNSGPLPLAVQEVLSLLGSQARC